MSDICPYVVLLNGEHYNAFPDEDTAVSVADKLYTDSNRRCTVKVLKNGRELFSLP